MNNNMFQLKSSYFAEVVQKFLGNHGIQYYPDKNNYSFKVGKSLFFVTVNYGYISIYRDESLYFEVYDFNEYNDNSSVFLHYALGKNPEGQIICKCTNCHKDNGALILTSEVANIKLNFPNSENRLVDYFMYFIDDDLENTLYNINHKVGISYDIIETEQQVHNDKDDVLRELYNLELKDPSRKRK